MLLMDKLDYAFMTTNNDFVKNLGQHIARLRKIQALSQKDIGKALGISQQAFARYEGGLRKIPIDMIPSLAHTLNTSIDQLLGSSDKKSKPGPSSQLEKYFSKVKDLPKKDQQFVIKFLNSITEK